MTELDLIKYLNKNSTSLLKLIGVVKSSYKVSYIPKKNGRKRRIEAPSQELKYVQNKLKTFFEWYYEHKIDFPFVASTGTLKKTNILSNARFHTNMKHILCLDIKNFYPSITVEMIDRVFKLQFSWMSEKHRLILLNLLTFEGHLPQGAPSSPIIGNIVFAHTDVGLFKYAEKSNLTYSRYVDDLTFSANEFIDPYVIKELEVVIQNNGFKLNPNKTRFNSKSKRQMITGIVVNQKANIKKESYKKLRAILHCINKDGINHSYQKTFNTEVIPLEQELDWYKQVIQGNLAYFKMILGIHNKRYLKLKTEYDLIFPKVRDNKYF